LRGGGACGGRGKALRVARGPAAGPGGPRPPRRLPGARRPPRGSQREPGRDRPPHRPVESAVPPRGPGLARPRRPGPGAGLKMALKVAIVGLPNVGKSTLFNALTQTAAAQAANYPFCTIEPNVGDVAVPEPRLEPLARIAKSKEIIPARINFVDVAGLVRGASKGEGLGNQFLAHIRDCDAVA